MSPQSTQRTRLSIEPLHADKPHPGDGAFEEPEFFPLRAVGVLGAVMEVLLGALQGVALDGPGGGAGHSFTILCSTSLVSIGQQPSDTVMATITTLHFLHRSRHPLRALSSNSNSWDGSGSLTRGHAPGPISGLRGRNTRRMGSPR